MADKETSGVGEIESGSASLSRMYTPPSNHALSELSNSTKIYFSRQQASESPEYHDTIRFSTDSSTGGGSRHPVSTSSRDVWGWYLYDFAASAYGTGVMAFFYPQWIFWLATRAAVSQEYPSLSVSSDSSSLTRCVGNVTRECVVCVLNQGYRYLDTKGDGRELPSLRLTLGGSFQLSPYSLTIVVLGTVLLLDLLVLITLCPLIDYGRHKKSLLAASTGVGVTAVMLSINLYTASLWWTAALLFMLSHLAFGQAVVVYNSLLLPLTRGMSQLQQSLMVGTTTKDQEQGRLRVLSSVSLKGAAVGNLGGFIAVLLAYGSVSFVPGVTDIFSLRASLTIAGLWWALWTFPACAWLRSYQGATFPDSKFRLSLGWRNLFALRTDFRRRKQAMWVLAAIFLASNGSNGLFQATLLYAREKLCMSTRQTVGISLAATGSAAVGCFILGCLQRRRKGSCIYTNLLLANILAVMALTSCYALLGFVTDNTSIGLHHLWEAYALAACYGVLAGPLAALTRNLLLDCVPQGQQGLMFSLNTLTQQAGACFPSILLSLLVHAPMELRYAFVYSALLLLSPAILLLLAVDQRQGMIDAGHIIQRDASDDIPLSLISQNSPRDFSSRSSTVKDLPTKDKKRVPPSIVGYGFNAPVLLDQ